MATKRKRSRNSQPHDGIRVKGAFRVQITEDGEVVGDSGWRENLITNDGFNNFLAKSLGAIAGSSQIGYFALGTGGAPVAADQVLAGEISGSTKRQAVTAATSSTSKAVQFTGVFSSANSFLAVSSNISNIGLFATTTTAATLFAGNTYASSACASNQNVNVSYTISWT